MRGAWFPFLFPTQVGPSFCGLSLSYLASAENWPIPAETLSLTWCRSPSQFPLVPQPYSLSTLPCFPHTGRFLFLELV